MRLDRLSGDWLGIELHGSVRPSVSGEA
jgi:hypothetical protein